MDPTAQTLVAPGRLRHGATPRRRHLPPQSFFLVSAMFHHLGPAFAVLLFTHLDVLGVAWL